MHTEGKASSFAQQGSPHPPAPISLASGFWDANASTREKAAWLALGLEPTPGSSLPGLIPVSAQVDGASPSATRPRPLDSVLVFGCRQVCIPLHSSGEACSCLSPKLAKLITVTQDLQFLRASRGAQADKAGAGCYAGPYGGIPFPASQCRLQAGSPGSAPTPTTIFLLSASPLTLQDYVRSDCLGSLIC